MYFLAWNEMIWIYYLLLINIYKFMSGYLCFRNSLKYIQDHA